ncbi:N-alpha-acetyltransferase, non-catalitic subunit [Rhodotorula kratochvilovae]
MDPLAVSEYADAVPLLEAAMADLAKGQLVRDERYAMMDLMSAIEVNDARTDTFLHAQKEREAHPDLPPFDPSLPLSAEEVLWVHDEILRLEATFHSGHPLSSTLWTCNYLRPASLGALSGLAQSTSAAPANEQSKLRTIVLRALLLGVLKTSEIAWEELSKGQVYEHEDVHLALGTLSFNTLMASCFPPVSPPTSPASPLLVPGQAPLAPEQPAERTVSVDDVLRALDDALRWLQAEEQAEAEWLSEEVRSALIVRVMLRVDLLYPIALLTFPAHTSPSSISHHLTRIQSYASLLPSTSSSPLLAPSSPPPALRAAFLPSPSVPLLATQQPPRPVVPLALGAAYDLLRALVADLESLMRLWERWRVGHAGWKELHEWCRARGRNEAAPYVRSLQQSLIATPTHLFSTSPLSTLSTSLLTTLTALPPSLFSLLPHLLLRESHPAQPAHRLSAFLARAAAKVAQHAPHQVGQNRARARRWAIKSLPAWGALVGEAEGDAAETLQEVLSAVEHALPPGDAARAAAGVAQMGAALAALCAELALDALLSGFEDQVGLFPGGEGAQQAWWVAGRVAARVGRAWERLLREKEEGEGGRAYLKAKRTEAQAVEAVCRACWLATHHPAAARPQAKFSSPFLPSLAIDRAAAERGRFRQRFEWLDKLPPTRCAEGEETLANWTAYCAERAALVKDELEQQSQATCVRALAALSALSRIPLSERGFISDEQAADHRLGPLSAVPSSAFGLPNVSPFDEVAALLAELGGEGGKRAVGADGA